MVGEASNQTAAISPCNLHEVLSRPGPVSIIELVETCIEEAHTLRASDIHINPTETEVEIRLRIDGVLHDKCRFSKAILPEVISRIKVLSHLRSDEHQAAQDGRFRMTTKAGSFVDIRVSITPTYYGENAVLRLLADHSSQFNLEMLGFSGDRPKYTELIKVLYLSVVSIFKSA